MCDHRDPEKGPCAPSWELQENDDADDNDDDILTFTFVDSRWEDKRLSP
jgi:hypothetical protein